ncbi:MAG: putative O-antigen transporter [Candidatus Sericytochromatia bacterium]|nr:MAG: putative O-antigen transporter [Candidatus Sericytochromatia bacterium]GIX42972.1 MAG: putative O-antigen transporter [Leptospiraceae bacterium]
MRTISIKNHYFVVWIGWISKVISTIFTLINTRLLIELVDINGFAAYSIVYSLVGWISLFNLGLPPAIQNEISKYRSKGKNIDQLLSLSFFLVIVITIIAIFLIFLITFIAKKYLLSNYTFVEFRTLYLSLFFLFFAGLTEIYYRILFAEQKGYLSNLYPSFIHIFTIIFLIALKTFNISDFNTVLVFTCFPYILIFFVSHFSAIKNNKPCFTISKFKSIYSKAKNFWIFAIMANLTLNIDYVIMSRILSPQDISIYNINMKIFNFIFVFYNTILLASWSNITEMYYKKEFSKIDSKILETLKIGLFILIIGTSLVLIFKDLVFKFISVNNLAVSYKAIILTALYFLLRIWTDTFAIVLQSMNNLDIFLKIVPIQAIISIITMRYFGSMFELNGIILGLIFSFILTTAWILPYKYYTIRGKIR